MAVPAHEPVTEEDGAGAGGQQPAGEEGAPGLGERQDQCPD
ncbi:hypothetical protein [Nonomuraea wenchangensis]